MSPDNVAPSRDALQFDRALTAGAPQGAASGATVVCANCGSSINTEYYHIGKHVVCEACRDIVQAQLAMPRGSKPFLKAGLFGVGAAIAGAIVYYAVVAITDFEIGIVAILIGYMVGYMVRKGTGGKGGRRFQILAVLLTYWSVGLAYTPLAFKGLDSAKAKRAAAADSLRAKQPDSVKAAAKADSALTSATTTNGVKDKPTMTGGELLTGLGALAFMTFALPVLVVFGSLPSGLLSGIIILIGLRQAWRMTAAPELTVTGPYRVGGGPTPSPV